MNVIVEDVGHAIKDMQKELLRIKEVAVDILANSILFLYIFIYLLFLKFVYILF